MLSPHARLTLHPDVQPLFSTGYFAVQKTMNVFSAMEIDQKQQADGGAVCLTESPLAMKMWMVACAEIARV